ncbi:hypothetical protein [Actinomadura sp. DC4]|nr:hypothetical protein [Actinomadura sp. DC4]MDN3354543.1 hypothetical protein [Actinomadura sp. DC4]
MTDTARADLVGAGAAPVAAEVRADLVGAGSLDTLFALDSEGDPDD